MTMWIVTRILESDNIKTRVAYMKYFTQLGSVIRLDSNILILNTAQACRELGNYNAITSLTAAFAVAPITRLYHTWEVIKSF